MSEQWRQHGVNASLLFALAPMQLALRSAWKKRYVCFEGSPATQPSELKKKRAVGLFRVPRGCQLQKSTALRRLCALTFAKGRKLLLGNNLGGSSLEPRHLYDLLNLKFGGWNDTALQTRWFSRNRGGVPWLRGKHRPYLSGAGPGTWVSNVANFFAG